VRRFWILLPVLLAGMALCVRPAGAMFAMSPEVPFDRLFKNVRKWVTDKPKEPMAHYTLGRLHSLAFARGEKPVRYAEKFVDPKKGWSGFPGYETIQQKRIVKSMPGPRDLDHLRKSIRAYRRATELAPKNSLYWLGTGWMLEQGAPFAARVDAPFGKGGKLSKNAWLSEARSAYRKAYTLDSEKDLQGVNGPGADALISLEAGAGLLRIDAALKRPRDIEVAAMVEKLKERPRSITPVIFPLDARAPLAALVSPDATATFDLAADTRPERWPWLTPNAGILVWDPQATGRITSGAQLFGSVTWCMFWRDGYEPLAALDDNRDGWLTETELRGIAVWTDHNTNAISDPGEVRTLDHHQIAAIAVTGVSTPDGPHNPRGLRLQSGVFAPTYDWTPRSLR
jgi:hypothetical protein